MKAIKISVIVQSTNERQVRDALGLVGAGKIGNYTQCQFITHGEAQFQPTGNADPTIGEKDRLVCVEAVLIQTWCYEDQVEDVVKAIKDSHPNEEPAIELTSFEMQ